MRNSHIDLIGKVLYKHMKDKFFGKNIATSPQKVRLYGEITPFVALPTEKLVD